MSSMREIDIGAYSAYAIAVKYGYQGTEEEWIQEQEANRVAAQNAADSANESMRGAKAAREGAETAEKSAADSARTAEQSKNTAVAGATTATNKAAEAEGSAKRAETAADKLEESASAAADSAQAAKNSEDAAKASESAAKLSEENAQAIKDSIPDDYTVLSQDVSSLKNDINELNEANAGLKDEIDFLHPLSITSFSVSPNLAEKGSTVSSETFAFAVNRLGAVLTLDDQTITGNSATRADVLTADKTYTLKAALNGATKTATSTIKFVAPVYYGVSDSYALENTTVLALTRVLTTSRSRNFTVTAASGQYILYALPTSLGTPTFKVGGFEGGFTLAGTFDFTNSSGHTESYNLYRTVNAGLGSTSVTVS